MRFTVIPQDTFEEMQVNAGVLLKTFDPAAPAAPDEAIITATTGGIQITCKPTYVDWGEDVDNCPNNAKELKQVTGWDTGISTTALGTSPEAIKLALGAADIDGTNSAKIVPRHGLKQTDFSDIWFVGDRADGGLVACRMVNALSQEGFVLQTSKNGKGQVTLSLRGHTSIKQQDVVPMEFYSMDPKE